MVTGSWTCYIFYSELFIHSYQIFNESFMRWTAVVVGMGQILYEPSVSAKTALLSRLTKLLWLSKARQPLITACFLKPWVGVGMTKVGILKKRGKMGHSCHCYKSRLIIWVILLPALYPLPLLCPPALAIALRLLCPQSQPGILNLSSSLCTPALSVRLVCNTVQNSQFFLSPEIN